MPNPLHLLTTVAVLALASVARSSQYDAQHSCVCAVGDLDGDGVGDVLVANRATDSRECVWAVSVKRAAVLYRVEGWLAGDLFGCALADIGDVDKDGVTDFAAGTLAFQWERFADRCGAINQKTYGRSGVRIVSGKTGKTVHDILAKEDGERLGISVAPAGDVNGDGVPDFLAGNTQLWKHIENKFLPVRRQVVDVYSGANGELLRRIESTEGNEYSNFGYSVALVGDVDGDSKPDWAIAAPGGSLANRRGRIQVISSQSGEIVKTIATLDDVELFGLTLAALPAPDGKAGFLAVASLKMVHLYDLGIEKALGVAHTHWSAIIDDFGSSVSLAFDPQYVAGPVMVIGANEAGPPAFFDNGYADLCGPDGKLMRALVTEDRTQGVDATALGDFDGDRRPDYACVLVEDMRLVLIGSAEKTVRRVVNLLDWKSASK